MASDVTGDIVEAREAFGQAPVVENFLRHYETLRGSIRTEIVRRHLEFVLAPQPPLRVVDIGCGDARDAIWLAHLGHHVVAVDPSQAMLEKAHALWASHKDEVANGSLDLYQGDEQSVTSDFGDGYFDLVLSHGVLMYQTNAQDFLHQHVNLLRDGGHLSLLTKNALALAYRAANEGRPTEAIQLLDDSQSLGHLGQMTQAHSPQDVADWLFELGAIVSSWCGIRIFSDQLDETTILTEEHRLAYAQLEWRAALLEPYRSSAPLIHIIARRGVDLSQLPG